MTAVAIALAQIPQFKDQVVHCISPSNLPRLSLHPAESNPVSVCAISPKRDPRRARARRSATPAASTEAPALLPAGSVSGGATDNKRKCASTSDLLDESGRE